MDPGRPEDVASRDEDDYFRVETGTVIGGHYRVVGPVGRGGMGTVYRAEHTRTLGHVALKVLNPGRLDEPRHRRRFELEARNAAVLRHNNTARVFDYGVDDSFDPPVPYLAMELVDGRPLSHLVSRDGALAWPRVIHIARQVLKSLGEAHEHPRQIVHRDVKPANILLCDQLGDADVVKVVDFGVARALGPGASGEGRPQRHERAGSPATMAPEQWIGGGIGPATDLYGLGCTVYELLAGRPPFDSNDLDELMGMHLARRPARLASLAPGVPVRLSDWVDTLMRKSVRRRPASAREALAMLDAIETGALDETMDADVDLSTLLELRTAQQLDRRTQVEPVRLDDTAPTLVTATPVPAAPPTNLAPAFTHFIGRQAECDALTRLFAEGARLVTLHGPGGTGKTRLSREWGRAQVDAFAGGVWFCDLTEATTSGDVMTAVAEALGLTLSGPSPRDQIARSLRSRGSVVVILDNLEQVVEPAAAALRGWLTQVPAVRFLATSRVRLGLQGEHLVTLGPLPLPESPANNAASALESDAVALFVDRARATLTDFELSDDDAADVAELVRRLDGMPLAIELAARRVRVLAPKQLLERLSRRFAVLKGRGATSGRQATLRATIDWSWNLLAGPEKHALCQCSVFRGGFDLDAAEKVIDLSAWEQGPDAPWTVDVIESLCDQSLLRVVDGPDGDKRLSMYVSIQEYAAEKLAAPGALESPDGRSLTGPEARADARRRHAEYYAFFGSEDFVHTLGRDAHALQRLRYEHENLHAIWQWSADDPGLLRAAAQAFWGIRELALRRGPQRLSVDIGQALAAHAELTPEERARLYVGVATVAGRAGAIDEATRCLQRAESLVGDSPGDAMRARIDDQWATVRLMEGHLDDARARAEVALAASRRAGLEREELRAKVTMAAAIRLQGDVELALSHFDDGLRLAERLGERDVMARFHVNTGLLHSDLGRTAAARSHLETGLQLAAEMGLRDIERWGLNYMGFVHHCEGDVAAALSSYRRSLKMAEQGGDLRLIAVDRMQIAVMELILGRHEAVRTRLGNLLASAGEAGEVRIGALARQLEIELWLGLSVWDEAAERARALRETAESMGEPWMIASSLATEGRAAYGRGDIARADLHLSNALDVLAESGSPVAEAQFAGYLAVARLAGGDLDTAHRLASEAEGGLREVSRPLELCVALCQRALVDVAVGRLENAVAACVEARVTVERIGARPPSELAVWLERAETALAEADQRD